MENIAASYLSLLFLEDSNHKLYSSEYEYIKSCIYAPNKNQIVDKYLLVGELGHLQRLVLILPVFTGRELDQLLEELRKVKGSRIRRLIITNVISGSMVYRKIE
jgi:hypothetical protein